MKTDRELLELAAKAAGLGLPTKDDTDEIGRNYSPALGLCAIDNQTIERAEKALANAKTAQQVAA